jgi:hypothetical protein
MQITLPDYAGGSLVNLISEIEHRLVGSARSPLLHPHLAERIPDAATYVLCLFDGLGSGQLAHPAAATLRESHQASIDCPFPATTTVSLSVLATGLPPSQHGLLGYQAWLPELEVVANTLQWTTLWGDPLDYELENFLPSPNLAERLATSGVETITIQPGNFLETNLTKVLFRGNRFEGIYTIEEWVDAVVQLAAQPNRLIVAYLPHVDVAAHVSGQDSNEYEQALRTVNSAWSLMCNRLPAGAVALATADHGHIDFPKHKQFKISKEDHQDRVFFGDGRAMYVKGEGASLAAKLPATWIPVAEMRHWWGPAPYHPQFEKRLPDGMLLADDDVLLLHRFSNEHLIGNHGALTDAERLIPLAVHPA